MSKFNTVKKFKPVHVGEKCSECRCDATGYHEAIPLCNKCFVIKKMKKHPIRLKIHLKRLERKKW